jgi:transcription antitermination factor NusG
MSNLLENAMSEVRHNPNFQHSTPTPQLKWYAVRVSYSRELALKAILDDEKMENFIPMQYATVIKGDKQVRKLVPAVHNLVFIHSTRRRIDVLKNELEASMPIRFIMDREHSRPIVIPDVQMHNFILVAGSYDEAVLYVEPTELHLVKGQKVRVTGGVFEGVTGVFVRFRHDRRVVVNIEGVMAVATTFIPPSMLEPVGNDSVLEKSSGKL